MHRGKSSTRREGLWRAAPPGAVWGRKARPTTIAPREHLAPKHGVGTVRKGDDIKKLAYKQTISIKVLFLQDIKNKIISYEESEELLGYVMDLQKFDTLIKSEVANGSLTISETDIEGLTDKNFEI